MEKKAKSRTTTGFIHKCNQTIFPIYDRFFELSFYYQFKVFLTVTFDSSRFLIFIPTG